MGKCAVKHPVFEKGTEYFFDLINNIYIIEHRKFILRK